MSVCVNVWTSQMTCIAVCGAIGYLHSQLDFWVKVQGCCCLILALHAALWMQTQRANLHLQSSL